jgi:hypothetical protein
MNRLTDSGQSQSQQFGLVQRLFFGFGISATLLFGRSFIETVGTVALI